MMARIKGYIILMFEVFPSMKSEFAEISLPRLSSMLAQPKPHPLAQHFDAALQSFFEKQGDVNEQALSKPFKLIYEYGFERAEFYELVSRSLTRILKRQLRKMEELIALHTRNCDQVEFNRIKLDKILKECFMRIEQSSQCIHELIIDMEEEHQWECHCARDLCQQRQSEPQFILDIFGFLLRTSQAIHRQVLQGLKRRMLFHPLLAAADQLCKREWGLGQRPGELLLQIESSCEKLKKAKKRKRNKKNKEKAEALQVEVAEDDTDQKYNSLLSLVSQLQIDDDRREECVVSQQWLQKLAARRHLPK